MRIIRYSFLAVCANLALSNAYAMDNEPSKNIPAKPSPTQATENPWRFEERTDYTLHRVGEMSKVLMIFPPEKFPVVLMRVGWMWDNTHMLAQISILPSNTATVSRANFKNQLDQRNISNDTSPDNCEFLIKTDNPTALRKFLYVFYSNDIIPDNAAVRMTQWMGIADFRINPAD